MSFSEVGKAAMDVVKETQEKAKELLKNIDSRIDVKNTLTDNLTKNDNKDKINDADSRIDFNKMQERMNDTKIGGKSDVDGRIDVNTINEKIKEPIISEQNDADSKNENKMDAKVNLKDVDIESRVLKDENGKAILDENGNKQYVDDNGKIFRKGNKLEKNCVYEVNGYTYHTDEKGRIISASGNVKIKNHVVERDRKNTISEIGKGSEKKGDHRGHIIGDQLGGSNGLENLVPQSDKLNQGDYKKLENQLKKEVENGNKVDMKVELKYDKNSNRPDKYIVTYHINGEKHKKVFPNGG